jgi:hypothetical protein
MYNRIFILKNLLIYGIVKLNEFVNAALRIETFLSNFNRE